MLKCQQLVGVAGWPPFWKELLVSICNSSYFTVCCRGLIESVPDLCFLINYTATIQFLKMSYIAYRRVDVTLHIYSYTVPFR